MRTLFPRVAFLTNAFIGPCGVHTLFVLERQLGVWVHTTTSSKQRALDALAEHVAGRACTQSVLAAARAELRVSYKDKSEVVAMRDRARSLVVLRDTVVRFNSNYSAEILPREAAVANAFVYSNETVQASLGPFWVELQPELADILDDLLGSDLDVFLHWLCSILAGEKLEIISLTPARMYMPEKSKRLSVHPVPVTQLWSNSSLRMGQTCTLTANSQWSWHPLTVTPMWLNGFCTCGMMRLACMARQASTEH